MNRLDNIIDEMVKRCHGRHVPVCLDRDRLIDDFFYEAFRRNLELEIPHEPDNQKQVA